MALEEVPDQRADHPTFRVTAFDAILRGLKPNRDGTATVRLVSDAEYLERVMRLHDGWGAPLIVIVRARYDGEPDKDDWRFQARLKALDVTPESSSLMRPGREPLVTLAVPYADFAVAVELQGTWRYRRWVVVYRDGLEPEE